MTKLTALLANLAPWCAPLPTAWLIGSATMRHLSWPVWVAIIAAITVELLGLSASVLALELRAYNVTKRKADPAAPVMAAYALGLGYVAIAIALTVALDIAPSLARYAPAIFPLLSLAAFVILAMRQDHAARVAQVAAGKAEAKAERAAHKAQGAQPVTIAAPPAYACGWGCGREFAKLQGRAAHMKQCAKRNGHEPVHVTQKVEVTK